MFLFRTKPIVGRTASKYSYEMKHWPNASAVSSHSAGEVVVLPHDLPDGSLVAAGVLLIRRVSFVTLLVGVVAEEAHLGVAADIRHVRSVFKLSFLEGDSKK